MTVKAGVIGWPVDHSLSPIIHRYWLKEGGIENAEYNLLPIPPEKFTREELECLHYQEGYIGFNVTVPLKEKAFELADNRDDAATFAGAANLLVFKDKTLYARNTDISGLQDSLMENLGAGFLGGKNIILLGAGGAARAIAYALQGLGVGTIWILNRHRDRAEKLAEQVRKFRPGAKFEIGTLDDWPSTAKRAHPALVINATSAGMGANPPLPIALDELPNKDVAICDIVYNPLETPLLKQSREKGFGRCIDGLGMLMHQAAPSFQAFFYPHLAMPPTPKVTPELRARLEQELQVRG